MFIEVFNEATQQSMLVNINQIVTIQRDGEVLSKRCKVTTVDCSVDEYYIVAMDYNHLRNFLNSKKLICEANPY